MNSYELTRPDGTPSGAWACGACDRVHVQTVRNYKPVSEANHARADLCCVPRNCAYCGLPTERDVVGDFPRVHATCIPPPDPPHPSMANPWARLLFRRMSDISEECWAAAWLIGNEYALWQMLQGDTRRFGQCEVLADELDELRLLSDQAQGWIWTGGAGIYIPQFVSLDEWAAILLEAKEKGDEIGSQ